MIGMKRNWGLAEVIGNEYPNVQWLVRDNDYNQLEWGSEDIPKPTLSELLQKQAELMANEPVRLMREIRDWYLTQSDWTQGADIRALRGAEWCQAWDDYRQQLRDITTTQTPYFANPEDLTISGVTWPTPPSIK